jgi:hypothetical protein
VARLRLFAGFPLSAYGAARDRPGIDGTSKLSPHLAFGEVSARQLWHAAGDGHGPASWTAEILWREFSAHLLWHHPTLPEMPTARTARARSAGTPSPSMTLSMSRSTPSSAAAFFVGGVACERRMPASTSEMTPPPSACCGVECPASSCAHPIAASLPTMVGKRKPMTAYRDAGGWEMVSPAW